MKKSAILFIFLFVLGFLINLVSPVLPLMFSEKGIKESFFGPFSAAFAIGSALFGFIIALCLHKIKINILPLIFIFGVTQLLYMFVTNELLFLIIRFFTGSIAGALIIIANANLNKLGRKMNRLPLFLSMSVGFFGLGNACGYLVGGIGSLHSYYLSIIIGVIVVTLFLPFTFFIRLEKIEKRGALKIKETVYYSIANMLFLTLFALLTTLIPFLIVNKIGYPVLFVGVFMFICGTSGLLVNLVINPFFKRKLKTTWSIIISLLIAASAIIASYFLSSLAIVCMIFIFFIAISLGRPLFNGLIIKVVKEDVIALGMTNMSMYIGNFFGAILSGITYSQSYNLSLSTGLMIIFILLCMVLIRKKQIR